MIRLVWLFGTLGIAVSACRPLPTSSKQKMEERSAREREAEYSVYSHLLRMYGNSLHLRVDDSTVTAGTLCSDVAVHPSRCIPPRPNISVEAWRDYARKNQKRWLLLPQFDENLQIPLARHAPLVEITCQAPTTIQFTRVGLNAELTQAVVSVSFVTGKGPRPGCGVAYGDWIVLERVKGRWRTLVPLGTWVT